jgi:hypothetical protein
MMRSGVLLAVVSAVALLSIAACGKSSTSTEEDGLGLPDRTDLPGDDAATTEAEAPRDASVDTAVVDAADAEPPGLRVFVSSSTSVANLGGRIGADAKCATLATTAGLPGTWVAWLSNEDGALNNAVERVTSAGPWRLVGGAVVATSKAQLISGALLHAIDRDEKGLVVGTPGVWTGTGPNGNYSTNDCNKWAGGGNNGRVGLSTSTDGTWTSSTVDGCGQQRRIYCFQLTL